MGIIRIYYDVPPDWKKEYLDHAIKVGKFIMNHSRLPKDKIPYWDFDAPNIPKADRDASAGAIMASAFVELSTYVSGELGKQFLSIGEQQINHWPLPHIGQRKWGITIISSYSIVLVSWENNMR